MKQYVCDTKERTLAMSSLATLNRYRLGSLPIPLRKGRSSLSILFLGGLVILVFGFLPVYLFPSGKPQLVDIPIFALIIIHFLRRTDAMPPAHQNILWMLPFILWAVTVNLVYFSLHSFDYLPLKKSAEMCYLFLVFSALSYLFRDLIEEKRMWVVYGGLLLSIVFMFGIKGYSEDGVRSSLSFNNPNQLGYFGLILSCMGSLLLIFNEKRRRQIMYYWYDISLLSVGHVVVLLSLSRGAILGLLLIDIWVFLRIKKKMLGFLPVVFFTVIGLVWQPETILERLEGRSERHLSKQEVAEELQVRILSQFSIMEGIQVLVGRGGRGFSSQDTARGLKEVHNVFGEVFRSYGIVGLMLFCFWMGGFIWKSRLISGGLWIWAALLLYNMSHYGIRFRSFWILLAFLNAMIWIASRLPEGSRELRKGYTEGGGQCLGSSRVNFN